jgi:hypothetical protein
MGLLEEAKADLMAAFKLDADNKPVKVELAKLKKALKEAKVSALSIHHSSCACASTL